MNMNSIISELDAEIARLESARAILAKLDSGSAPARAKPTAKPHRRKMSKAARERIAAAQRKRWKAQRANAKAPRKGPAKVLPMAKSA